MRYGWCLNDNYPVMMWNGEKNCTYDTYFPHHLTYVALTWFTPPLVILWHIFISRWHDSAVRDDFVLKMCRGSDGMQSQEASPSAPRPWDASFPVGAEEATICIHTKQHHCVTVRMAKTIWFRKCLQNCFHQQKQTFLAAFPLKEESIQMEFLDLWRNNNPP